MEEKKDTLGMLDLVIRPGFCVRNNQIVKVNQAAESLFITDVDKRQVRNVLTSFFSGSGRWPQSCGRIKRF